MAATLPSEDFSQRLRDLRDNPGALKAESTIHTHDFYGNTASWIIQTFRVDGQTWAFVQRNDGRGFGLREVFPPEIMAALLGHEARLIARGRKRAARQAVETKRAKGLQVGNVAALAKALKNRKRRG